MPVVKGTLRFGLGLGFGFELGFGAYPILAGGYVPLMYRSVEHVEYYIYSAVHIQVHTYSTNRRYITQYMSKYKVHKHLHLLSTEVPTNSRVVRARYSRVFHIFDQPAEAKSFFFFPFRFLFSSFPLGVSGSISIPMPIPVSIPLPSPSPYHTYHTYLLTQVSAWWITRYIYLVQENSS